MTNTSVLVDDSKLGLYFDIRKKSIKTRGIDEFAHVQGNGTEIVGQEWYMFVD